MSVKKYLTEKNLNLLLAVALLLLLVPAALAIVRDEINEWTVGLYIAGEFIAVLTRVLQRVNYRKDKSISTRVRRLLHIEFWSSISYLVSAYFMVSDPYHPGNWIAFLLAGAVLQIYTSQMIAWQQKKESRR